MQGANGVWDRESCSYRRRIRTWIHRHEAAPSCLGGSLHGVSDSDIRPCEELLPHEERRPRAAHEGWNVRLHSPLLTEMESI